MKQDASPCLMRSRRGRGETLASVKNPDTQPPEQSHRYQIFIIYSMHYKNRAVLAMTFRVSGFFTAIDPPNSKLASSGQSPLLKGLSYLEIFGSGTWGQV